MTCDPRTVLMVRPRPLPFESIGGYLDRVAAMNGFLSPSGLLARVKGRQQSPILEIVCALALTKADTDNLFGALPKQWGWARPSLGLAASDFNYTRYRWCPICLSQLPYIHGYWSMKLVCVCLKHNVWLHERCQVCGTIANWSNLHLNRCECGVPYSPHSSTVNNDVVIEMSKALCGDLADVRCLPNELLGLSSAQVHRLVRYLGHFPTQRRPGHPGQVAGTWQLETARVLIKGAAEMLREWPNRLHALMRDLQSSAKRTLSVRQTFAPLYRVFFEDLAGDEFQFLRDGFESYLHENWWGLVCRRNKLLKEQTIKSHPRLTLPQAATVVGVGESVIRHLVQAELLDAETTMLESGRQARSVREDDTDKIKTMVDGAVNLATASRLLALPERRVRDLISACVIRPLIHRRYSKGAGAWLIPRVDIERFYITTPLPPLSESSRVRDVLKYWGLSEKEAVEFLVAVHDGRIGAATGGQHQRVPIGEALIATSVARDWLRQTRNVSAETLSVDQAARALGIKQQVAYDLVRQGLLCSVDYGSRGRRVCPGDVELFRQTYISLADVARNAKRAPRAVLKSIRSLPVSGPAIDGSRQYFYRRSDIQTRGAYASRSVENEC